MTRVAAVFSVSGPRLGQPLKATETPIEFLIISNMKKTMEQTMTVDEASVSRVAYQLWENAGRPAGRDLEFWLAAEAHVRSSTKPISVALGTDVSALSSREQKSERVARSSRGGIKKTWPKPYPSLPKF